MLHRLTDWPTSLSKQLLKGVDVARGYTR